MLGSKLHDLLCITCRIQGPNAIRYEIVAMDAGFGQGLRRVET